MRRKLKTKRLIDLHKEWCETGKMSDYGLCSSVWSEGVSGHSAIKYRNALKNYFKPTVQERAQMSMNGESFVYWASGVQEKDERVIEKYTELRQNIALFICAMFDEL